MIRYETPKTLGFHDMFAWWCKNKIKKKRHLKVLGVKCHNLDTRLVSKNSDELEWLKEHIIVLAEQIKSLSEKDSLKAYVTKDTHLIYQKNRELYQAKERIKSLSKLDGNTVQIVATEPQFKKVLDLYNRKIRTRLVEKAELVNLNAHLGAMYIQNVRRDEFKSNTKAMRMPNWGESHKIRKAIIASGKTPKDKDHPDGEEWVIYFEDSNYIKYTWSRRNALCTIKNFSYYRFIPSHGKNGSRKELAKANRANKFLIFTYKSSVTEFKEKA